MIADQAGTKIYNEQAFKSQYFNKKGGIREGNVWIHCGNHKDQDMVQIGNTIQNGFYPGMTYNLLLKT